ncbi:hypothetical protein MY520_05680 [Geodermatophilus sp. CPCC 205506]
MLGFVVLAGLVVALGRGSTARYEYERNSVAAQPAAVPAAAVPGPAAGRGGQGATAARSSRGEAAAPQVAQRTAVGVAAHPAGRRAAESAPAWWLVDESDDEPGTHLVAGPFTDRIDAEWAALASGLSPSTRPVHGVQRADGAVVLRQTPQERAWLAELGSHLARLSEDWDLLPSDTDPRTTLVVEVGAALTEAGLPLHDCAGSAADDGGPAGGVCLSPDLDSLGILVSWHQHDRMSLQQVRGADVVAAVQQTMTTAIATVLTQLGFQVESIGWSGGLRVTAATDVSTD